MKMRDDNAENTTIFRFYYF